MQGKGHTASLGDENRVRRGFNCEKGERRTHLESKMGKDNSMNGGFECEETDWTHNLGDENGVSSVFECDKGDGPTWETKVIYYIARKCMDVRP